MKENIINNEEEVTIDLEGHKIKTTKEGKKYLTNLLVEHNELNHSKKNIDIEENEVTLPKAVMDKLGIEDGKQVGFKRVNKWIDPDTNKTISEDKNKYVVYLFNAGEMHD